MKWGAHVLDCHMAPRLSELTSCEVPDVPALPHYRASLILNHVFCGAQYEDWLRVPISIFITRLREAIVEYRAAAESIRVYVAALPNHDQLGAHTRAVAHFETCVLKADLASTALKTIGISLGDQPIWKKRDGSVFSRLHLMSNRIKHFDEDITEAVRRKLPVPLTPVWLRPDRLECADCYVTFEEFAFALKGMAEDAENFAEKLPARALERRRAERDRSAVEASPQSAQGTPVEAAEPAPVQFRIAIPAP